MEESQHKPESITNLPNRGFNSLKKTAEKLLVTPEVNPQKNVIDKEINATPSDNRDSDGLSQTPEIVQIKPAEVKSKFNTPVTRPKFDLKTPDNSFIMPDWARTPEVVKKPSNLSIENITNTKIPRVSIESDVKQKDISDSSKSSSKKSKSTKYPSDASAIDSQSSRKVTHLAKAKNIESYEVKKQASKKPVNNKPSKYEVNEKDKHKYNSDDSSIKSSTNNKRSNGVASNYVLYEREKNIWPLGLYQGISLSYLRYLQNLIAVLGSHSSVVRIVNAPS